MSGHSLTDYTEIIDVLESLRVLVREKRRRNGLALRPAAEEIGLHWNVVMRFEKGGDAMLSNVIKMLEWVGLP